MKTPTIRLWKDQRSWYADFAETPECNKMIDLFGTTSVPLPYAAESDVLTVLRIVRDRNPYYMVVAR